MGFFDDLLSGLGIIKSPEQRELENIASRSGTAQADRIEQGTRLRSDAERMIREMAKGGAPPPFRLGLRGEGTDIGEFLSQIQPNAELNKLMALIGAGEGNIGSANSALSGSLALEDQRKQDLQNLTTALLLGISGGFGGGGGKERV